MLVSIFASYSFDVLLLMLEIAARKWASWKQSRSPNILETSLNIYSSSTLGKDFTPLAPMPLSVPTLFTHIYPIFLLFSHKSFIFAFCNYCLFPKLQKACLKLNFLRPFSNIPSPPAYSMLECENKSSLAQQLIHPQVFSGVLGKVKYSWMLKCSH